MKTSRRIFDSETMQAIGSRMREIRGERTLAEFTEKLGLARTTWSNYEAGRRLPSHEVLELLRMVEGVPPDRILPSALLKRETAAQQVSDWFKNIAPLWLFARLKGRLDFDSEGEELKWWAERLWALCDELGHRAFELGEKRDIELEDAALQVCEYLSSRTTEELVALVEGQGVPWETKTPD